MPTGVYKRTKEMYFGRGVKISESKTGKKLPPLTKEWRRKISDKLKGRMPKFIPDNTGRKHSQSTINKIKEARKKQVGVNHPLWKGGISPVATKIRTSKKYIEWRQNIFIRDNFTCQKCFENGCYLEAHHIKPFCKFIEEIKRYLPLLNLYDGAMIYTPLWDLENGITLCKPCHKKEKR